MIKDNCFINGENIELLNVWKKKKEEKRVIEVSKIFDLETQKSIM